MEAAEDNKEDTSMEVAEGGGSEEGDTTAVAEAVEDVEEAITQAPTAETVETEQTAKVNLE
jgi:hypothetical protein